MAESTSQTRPPRSSQYHHFIPRFLLRNFAVFKNPGKVIPKTSKKSKNRAPRPQKLTVLDFESGTFKQGDVSDTFGIVDMYRDFEKAGRDQQKLERELSVLESAAGEIFARVKTTYDAGKKEFQLSRKEKDILRRFLFIMMYRNSSFGRRFERSREDYDSNDRESMLAYMDEKGIQTPRDVWFANIRAFLEVELDEDWPKAMAELEQRAYPMDARWFFMHVQAFFIAFCTPKKTGDEFLLTQNVYGVYEGPTSAGPWTDYHRFAPVSPKIMIVLRSVLLPCAGVEVENETSKMLLEWQKSMHLDPEKAGSCLEDIPVSRARNNYSKVVDGKVEPLPTRMPRDKHIFYFPFFPLDHEHLQKINMICLENAYDTVTMVYKSPESLRTALEFYLTDKTPGFKVICRPRPNDANFLHKVVQKDGPLAHVRREDKLLPYLRLLLKFARQLGSTVELEYNSLPEVETILPEVETILPEVETILDRLETIPKPTTKTEERARYEKLGGGASASVVRDLDQVRRIVQFIIKVDTLIRKESNEIKQSVRRNREDWIATLPPRRVWLSIKQLRYIGQGRTNDKSTGLENNKHTEDAIVDASHVFKADSLARIIYKVFSIDRLLREQPDFGLVKAYTLDEEGAERIRQELYLVFDKPGSIRNCGIAVVENAARWLATQPRPGRNSRFRLVSDEQMLELWMRQGTEVGFEGLLKDELGGEELRALKDVFFHLLYRSEFGGRVRK